MTSVTISYWQEDKQEEKIGIYLIKEDEKLVASF